MVLEARKWRAKSKSPCLKNRGFLVGLSTGKGISDS